MTSIGDIVASIQQIPDDRIRELSQAIASKLAQHLADKDHMWTFQTLSRLVGADPGDPALRESVLVLASRPRTKLLDVHYLYFNPEDEDDIGTPVDDEAVAQAYRQGFVEDPITGEGVRGFEDRLVPYFLISTGVGA